MLVLILRTVHILLGVFWAGAIFLVAGFVGPAIADAGPDGAKVMGALVKRKLLNIVPAAATLTILSGLWLYWRDSAGFQEPWMGSPMSTAIGTGAVLSLVAFVIGLAVMRASTLKAVALGQSLAQLTDGATREATTAQIQVLRRRAGVASRVVAVLLAVAVVAMAIARYL